MRNQTRREKAARARSSNVKQNKILVTDWSEENNKRANNAQRALSLYLRNEHDPATAVRALLADLRHYCDARKVDFREQYDIADRNYMGQVLELI
jgi:hypothetical protein